MRRILTLLSLATITMACGSDRKGNKRNGATVPRIESPSLAIQTQADLPPCTSISEGHLVYIMTEELFYTCTQSKWTSIEIKGEKGDPGEKGDSGSTTDRFQLALDLYKNYRRSVTRIKLECDSCTSGDSTAAVLFGSGFFCAEKTICTNAHVTNCPVNRGCQLKRLSAQIVDGSSDSVRPGGTEIAPFYTSTDPDLDQHPTKDLAKIHLPSMPSAARIIPLADAPRDQTDDVTLMGVLSLSFPLGFHDLYTDVGYVNNNDLEDCNTDYCPGPYYDFSTTNDTDKGSSGSPLLGIESGKVIGVTTSGTEGENANYTWAIDASYFDDF